MSYQSNQIVSFWEVAEYYTRRKSIRRRGQELAPKHQKLVQDAYVLLSLCWHDLLTNGGLPTSGLDQRWFNTLVETDLIDVVDCFKEADALLVSMSESIRSYGSFKHYLNQSFPFVGQLLSPLKGEIAAWTKDRSIPSFSSLHTAFVFLGRLNLKGLKDLEDEAFADYLENEKLLKTRLFTQDEESIINRWFPREARFELFRNWHPKHGPGAVANRNCKCIAHKMTDMGQDCLLQYLERRLDPNGLSYPRGRVELDRTSRVVFVPKSISKLRTICAEPTVLQWYQQGFLRAIDLYIRDHKYLKRRINLAKQELNRDLARLGSIDGSFSTIDLSAASDSVSWNLVQSWFDYSALREIFACTRSKNTMMPDNSVLKNNKFAPMGSALCFPTECLVFCAIVEAAIKETGGSPTRSRYRVYGDDIVVETMYAEAVIDRLQRNGFRINRSKSFSSIGSLNFRESCGGEYVNGEDVTPVRLSRWFTGVRSDQKYDPSRILSCVDLCNRCYSRLPSVRRYLISYLNKMRVEYRVPFDSNGEIGIFSVSPTNYHLKKPSHDKHLQCDIVNHGGVTTSRPNRRPDDEDIRLYEYLRSTHTRQRLLFPEDASSVEICPPERATWGRKRSFVSQLVYAKPML